jgi:hypothetical protein
MAGIIRKCYGCGQAFSERYRNAPNDLVLKRYDHRMYLSPRSKIPQHSASLQNTYFHLNVDCARKKNPQFEFRDILIHNEIKQNLSPEHKLKSDMSYHNDSSYYVSLNVPYTITIRPYGYNTF